MYIPQTLKIIKMSNMAPTGDDWHLHTVALLGACIGQISSNFRLVSLRFTQDQWMLRVILEADNSGDVNAANEILEDYTLDVLDKKTLWEQHNPMSFSVAAYQKIQSEIFITKEPIEREQDDQLLWIYRRKESHCA